MPVPVTPPPAQPVDQFQFQQNPNVYVNDNEKNETYSRSSSRNANNLSGSLANYQINNNYDNFFQYENGVKIPATSLSITGFASEYDYGAVVTLNIPIGKGNRKLARRQIEGRVEQTRTNNVTRKLESCATIHDAGFDITDYDALGLSECKYMSKRQVIADASEAVRNYQDTIRQQQIMIDKLIKRIDRMETERGNPFNSRG